MSTIRGRDTAPERQLRSFLHGEGFRFRKDVRSLPGRPDVVLPKHRAVVFVHGCFWHQHRGCPRATVPKSNVAFWATKFAGNRARDRTNERKVKALGWRVFVIWECELSQARLRRLTCEIRGRARHQARRPNSTGVRFTRRVPPK